MELLFALFMTENKSKPNNSISSKDSLVERGYLPLQNLSEKYGYAKDYVGWLARAGRLEAIRHGKYGQWYVLEESLKKYQALKPSSKIDAGYFPLHDLADKYGYAKDHLGWLSRTGRIEAVRHGKYGQWYASEGSLKKYQISLIPSSEGRSISVVESKVVPESKSETILTATPLPVETPPIRIEQLRVKTPTTGMSSVLSLSPQDNSLTAEKNIVLCKNDGSYSADSGVGSRQPSEVSRTCFSRSRIASGGDPNEVWDASMPGNSVEPERIPGLIHRLNAILT